MATVPAKKAASAAAGGSASVSIVLNRAGGALIRADVFVYADPSTNSPTLVESLAFKSYKTNPESQSVALPPGTYAAKTYMTLREGINTDFEYELTANGVLIAKLDGDTKKLSATNGQPDPLVHTRFFTV